MAPVVKPPPGRKSFLPRPSIGSSTNTNPIQKKSTGIPTAVAQKRPSFAPPIQKKTGPSASAAKTRSPPRRLSNAASMGARLVVQQAAAAANPIPVFRQGNSRKSIYKPEPAEVAAAPIPPVRRKSMYRKSVVHFSPLPPQPVKMNFLAVPSQAKTPRREDTSMTGFQIDNTSRQSILSNVGIADEGGARAGSLTAANEGRPRLSMYRRGRDSMGGVCGFARFDPAPTLVRPMANPSRLTLLDAAGRKTRTPLKMPVTRFQQKPLIPSIATASTSTPMTGKLLNGQGQLEFDVSSITGRVANLIELTEVTVTNKTNALGESALAPIAEVSDTAHDDTPLEKVENGNGSKQPAAQSNLVNIDASSSTRSSKSPLIRFTPGTPAPNKKSPTAWTGTDTDHRFLQTPAEPGHQQRASTATLVSLGSPATIDYEQVYAGYSEDELRKALDSVLKQKAAIEKLLDIAQRPNVAGSNIVTPESTVSKTPSTVFKTPVVTEKQENKTDHGSTSGVLVPNNIDRSGAPKIGKKSAVGSARKEKRPNAAVKGTNEGDAEENGPGPAGDGNGGSFRAMGSARKEKQAPATEEGQQLRMKLRPRKGK